MFKVNKDNKCCSCVVLMLFLCQIYSTPIFTVSIVEFGQAAEKSKGKAQGQI